MQKYLTGLLLFLNIFSFTAYSQKTEPIQTDRPDQTETPFLVPAKHWQFETGFTFEKTDENVQSFLYPTILSKYGVNDHFELRLITEIAGSKTDGQHFSGLNPIKAGIKVALAEENGIFPKTSFIGHISIPTLASKTLQATYFAPSFRFTMQHTLTQKLSLSYNLGSEWDGENAEPTFIYTLTAGYALSEKLGSYIEVFGFAPQKDKADHRFDGGLSYLLRSNVLIDISGGAAITNNAPAYYASFGFSFRLKD